MKNIILGEKMIFNAKKYFYSKIILFMKKVEKSNFLWKSGKNLFFMKKVKKVIFYDFFFEIQIPRKIW